VGSALLTRLLSEDVEVRCLVRDPRKLGPQRVRVQIALGDLLDPPSFRNALRDVDTVVHLAGSVRDQPRGSIEELVGIATWRMVGAAHRAGVQRFLFSSVLNAESHHQARYCRAKALAEQAIRESPLTSTVLCTSLVYAPSQRWLAFLERLTLLPVMPIAGSPQARFQPIWAQDVAACAAAVLRQDQDAKHQRLELAGPQTLTLRDIARLVMRASARERPLLELPNPLAKRLLNLLERVSGRHALLTWEDVELLKTSMISQRGSSDALALGVNAHTMQSVLGVS
jgi:uncharacterized protein YbjT (DUF2867 family)